MKKMYRFILTSILLVLFLYFSKVTLEQENYLNFIFFDVLFGFPIFGFIKKRKWAVNYVWVMIATLLPLIFLILYFGLGGTVIVMVRDLGALAIVCFINYKVGLELGQGEKSTVKLS